MHLLYQTSLQALTLLAMPDFRIRHTWFRAIFFFCAIIVFANIVHYILFRILRRQKDEARQSWQAAIDSARSLEPDAQVSYIPDLEKKLRKSL